VASSKARVHIQHEDFDPGAEQQALHAENAQVGAIASFTGLVRAHNQGTDVVAMTLEHYPGMTERAIEAMIDAAHQRFPALIAARVLHRVGPLKPLDRVVWVGTASSHRAEAFAACQFLMDYLKTQAPFWKKERSSSGDERWVDARSKDDAALQRWGVDSRNAVHAE
jgi:molybdopterin synthase catalytic subunit